MEVVMFEATLAVNKNHRYGCAQFMNDALCPDLDSLVHPITAEIVWDACIKEMETYMRKSDAVTMTYSDPRPEAKCWFFAKRNIRQGEEVITKYGEHYWFKRTLATSTNVGVLLVIMCIYEGEYLEARTPSEEWTYWILKRYKLYDAIQKIWLKVQNTDLDGVTVSLKDILVMLMQTLLKRHSAN
jgi:hypothetical protein